MKALKRSVVWLLVFAIVFSVAGYDTKAAGKKKSFKYDFGVFLSAGPKDIGKMAKYKTIVIDAQNDYTKKDISKLKKQGHTVYSYINVGSVEEFRPYYDTYEGITLGSYDNYPDERWVDVSKKSWQDFIVNNLSVSIKSKGVDGFFVDNVDVYYYVYSKTGSYSDGIYAGLESILRGLKKQGKVIINGGNSFVKRYMSEKGNLGKILNGVCQESVFSHVVDYETSESVPAKKDSTKAYKKYFKEIGKAKKKVYIIEYTKDKSIRSKVKKYCKKNGFSYYIRSNVTL